MKIVQKFKRLLMPNTHFEFIYSQQTAYIRQAANALLQMVKTPDIQERLRLEREVKMCEIQGDALLTEFYEQLNEGLISTLDRSDLQTIAMDIDEVLDHIKNSAKSILIYKPEKIDIQLVELAEYICAEADALAVIVTHADNVKKNSSDMLIQCDRITELEHAADETYEEYIAYIFDNEKDPIQLIKVKNIAEMLEDTTDTAKTVSDHIRKLMLRFN